MPATREEEEKESNLAACLAAAAAVTGIFLVAVSFAALQSGALHVVDSLVTFDEAWHARLENPPFVITTRRVYAVLIFVGLFVIATSLVGALGAKLRHRHLVCTHVTLAGAFAAVMLLGGVHTLQRRAVVEPLISRQVIDICNSSRFMRLAANIPCDFAKAYAPSELTPCGIYCGWRVDLLRQLHGCQVMPRLCQKFFYEELQSTSCATEIAEGGSSMMYMAVEGSERCRELCDEDIRCTAYAYSGASTAKPQRCLLGQGVASAHSPPRWSPVHPEDAAEYLSGGSSISCHKRGAPVVLERFRTHGLRLALSTLALGLVLAVSTAVSCCLMYNVNIKRRGTPTAHELSWVLCCPCCAWETQRRFFGNPEDEESEEEEVDSEGGS